MAGVLDFLDQLASLFVGRNTEPTPEPEAPPVPVVEKPLSAPPYPVPVPAAPQRKQQEVFYVVLNAAGTPGLDSAVVTLRTRCDFFTVYTWSNAATAYEGIWVELGANPSPIPVGTVAPQGSPFFLANGKAVTIHGAEQTLSLTNGNNNIMQVIVTANTNVPQPYQ